MQDWIQLGLLAVQVGTAVIIAITTRHTRDLKATAIAQVAASLEQAEATLKPCIVVDPLPPMTSKEREVEELVHDPILTDDPGRKTPTIVIRNIGMGPATRLQYKVETGGKGLRLKTTHYLAKDQAFDTELPRYRLQKYAEFVAEYDSLSGSRYSSTASIEDGQRLQSFGFRKLPVGEPYRVFLQDFLEGDDER